MTLIHFKKCINVNAKCEQKADGYQAYHILTKLVIFTSVSSEAVNDVYRELMKAQCFSVSSMHTMTSGHQSSGF